MRAHLLLTAAFAATLLYTTSSYAQSIAVDGIVTRSTKSGEPPTHPEGIPTTVVTMADCQADEILTVPLTLSGSFLGVGLTLEAWAGDGTTDCTAAEARTTATASCWRIAGFSSPLPLAQQVTVDVRAQDLVSQVGASVPKLITSTQATSSACTSKDVTFGPHAVRAYFFFANGATASGTAASLDLTAALSTPPLVGDITATPGPARITVGIPPAQDTSIKGINVYCDVNACGTAAGGTAPDNSFLCGHGTQVDSTIVLDSLTPGREYRIAAAPTDQWGNIGTLSNTACATPDAGTSASGGGGGSGCAVTSAPSGGGIAAFIAGLGAIAGAITRRRRART